jgi:Flp pilus assembly protein TadG
MKIFRNDKGAILIITALSLVILLGFGALALDLGFVYMKNVELQTTADAAALAGAGALVSYGKDFTKIEEKVHKIIKSNFDAQKDPSGDVAGITTITYYKSNVLDAVDPNQVEVEVNRSETGGNSVALFLARALGFYEMELKKVARAEAYLIGGSKCLKPFAIAPVFTWDDTNGNGEYDFDPKKGTSETITSVALYSQADYGVQKILKMGTQNNIVPGQYNPIALPPINRGGPDPGGANYRDNLAGCGGTNNDSIVAEGDLVSTEPGNMVGPTKQGLKELIDLDPGAHWVGGDIDGIVGSSYDPPTRSPRVGIVVVYDPKFGVPSPGRDDPLKVLQLIGFFIEGLNKDGDITGRIIGPMAVDPGGSGPGNNNLLYWIRLIKDSTRGA